MYQFFEHPSAMFITLELVETRTGRGENDDVSGYGQLVRSPHSILQGFCVLDVRSPVNLRFNLGRGSSNRVDTLHSLA